MDNGPVLKTVFLSAALAFGLLWLTHFPAMAGMDDCTGTVDGGSKDNLRVPQNATCTLKGTQIKGNITVAPNATLYAFNARVGGGITVAPNATLNAFNVRVAGDIEAEDASQVSVFPGSFVGGSVRILRSGAVEIDGVEIGGDLLIHQTKRSLKAAKSIIAGTLRAFENSGRATMISNTVTGDLQCQENVFAPEGGGNMVSGAMEGQCKDLGKPPPPEEDCCKIK